MGLANDYFLLYHGITFEQNLDVKNIETTVDEETFSIFALILCAERKNYKKFLQVQSLKKLCRKINVNIPTTLNELSHLQHQILKTILDNKSIKHIEILHQSFKFLKDEKIIDTNSYEKLISLFDLIELELIEEKSEKNNLTNKEKSSFKTLKLLLDKTLEELKNIIEDQELKKDLSSVKEYLDNQKFSIGITGVMNAGKSTMLNALMGKEILGSAVVPETANLSIVKYSKEEKAKVYYWNKSEWERIENSAKELESMRDFVKETNEIFKDNLNEYIQENSKYEQINIKDLSSYTSAETSGKKCNLVKYVELGSNLKFLSDGIQIVDTPGLDDPVIQREEITKDYICTCDMLLHLMNVSQSATLKDIEFIIDALLYQNISKLLIVITRADTVSKKQLNEVIEYTKTSIRRQLEIQNKDSKLDYILEHIKFIPISGKMALLHRTNREDEAIKAGFNLEDTGILEIEEYLNETLFGANSQKGELIIQASKMQLQRLLEKQNNLNNYKLNLLSKSKEELEEELKKFEKKKNKNNTIFKSIKEDINFYKNDAKEYIYSLETFLQSEMLDLKNIIKQRVISDVRYSFEKTKKRPESSRIKVIIQTAIKDGIIDIIRDYRYKFIKKTQNIGEQCEQKYHDKGFSISKDGAFNAIEFFQNNFKSGFLTSNNDVLISQIINAVSKAKASKLSDLDGIIEEFIQKHFIPIQKDMEIKTKKISIELIETFFEVLNKPLENLKQKLKDDERILEEQINSFENNQENAGQISIKIHKNIKQINSFSKKIKELY